jgi:hypothetical protein
LMWILICTAIFVAGVCGVLVSVVALNGNVALSAALGSVVLMIGSAIVGAIIAPILQVTRITLTHAHFSRANALFLSELPEWKGQ